MVHVPLVHTHRSHLFCKRFAPLNDSRHVWVLLQAPIGELHLRTPDEPPPVACTASATVNAHCQYKQTSLLVARCVWLFCVCREHGTLISTRTEGRERGIGG
jgi:hypothetical protein